MERHDTAMQATSDSLREKLLQQELRNLEETMHRIESLGVPLEMFETVKNMVKKATKMVTGSKDINDVYNHLVKHFTADKVNKTNNVLHVMTGGKQVDVSMNDTGKWQIAVDGKTYEVADLNDMVKQIQIRTQASTSAPFHDVARYSSFILKCKAGGMCSAA